jgi:hypothetical protein
MSTDSELIERLRRELPNVSAPAMRSDNLCITLASFFEPLIDSDEMDDSGTWKQGAIDASNEVMAAIHSHYAVALAEAEKQRDEAIARADKATSANERLQAGNSKMAEGWVALINRAEAAEAKLRVAVEAQAKLSAFVRYVLVEGSWAGDGLDGGDAQDAAERFGLISPAPYDPAKHGYHVDFSDGDRWFKFTPLVLPLSSIGATTPGGEAMSTDNVLTERLLAAARIEALSLALAEAEKQRDEAEARLRVVVEALRPFALAASGIPADKKDKDITRVAMDEILSKEEIDRFREIGRPVRSPHAELLVSLDGLRARDFRRARAALSSIGEV